MGARYNDGTDEGFVGNMDVQGFRIAPTNASSKPAWRFASQKGRYPGTGHNYSDYDQFNSNCKNLYNLKIETLIRKFLKTRKTKIFQQ
jgi:hypothetical protein